MILLVLLAFICFVYHQTNFIQVNQVDISLQGLPMEFEDFTIVQISDLHGKSFGHQQQHLIELIDLYYFDIVVLTGDMFKDNDEQNSMRELKYFIDYILHQKQKTIYFVAGNHDLGGDYDYITKQLTAYGVHVLDNRSVKIERKNAVINLVGIKDALFGKANLDKTLQNARQGLKILLAHTIFSRGDRSILNKIKQKKIDLVLTGHTHGNQINIFSIYVTGEGLFPKFMKGLHRLENSFIYISRGLGTSGVNFRLFSRPELAFIRLKTFKSI